MGVLPLENKGEEAPPHKELGLSNLYAGGPSILYVLFLYVLFAPPILEDHPFVNPRIVAKTCVFFRELQTSGKRKAHKHKSFWPVTPPVTRGSPDRRPGVKDLCAILGTQGT